MKGGRKIGKRKDGSSSMSTKNPLGKTQKAVTHWLKKNVPTKKTKFLHSHIVEYFVGKQAIDILMTDSPWAPSKVKDSNSLVFDSREIVTEYLDELLKHKMFHRAKKIPVREKKKEKKDGETEAEQDKTETDKKRRRKIRLDMHLDQVFVDTNDAYVWLYDPIPWYYWAGGSLIVLGIIAVCLFPLWPPMMRQGVHYIVVAAAGFLICIIPLAILKYIVYGVLFILTSGKLKLWIFPNLTEDVGFFESFVPLYEYTYTGGAKKKAKDSDGEESEDEEEESSDDSTSKKSSTGKDFEMVSKNDTDVDE